MNSKSQANFNILQNLSVADKRYEEYKFNEYANEYAKIDRLRSALGNEIIEQITNSIIYTLKNSPDSITLFDKKETCNYYTLKVHIPDLNIKAVNRKMLKEFYNSYLCQLRTPMYFGHCINKIPEIKIFSIDQMGFENINNWFFKKDKLNVKLLVWFKKCNEPKNN